MTWRGVVAISGLVALAAIDGCSLARDVLSPSAGHDAGLIDTGRVDRDVGRPDGGRRDSGTCVVGGCDDGNPCTDDVCVPATGCTHTPNAATCNDGMLCNGADTCAGGTCSVHDGVNPCSGGATCDPVANTCAGCRSDADCPAPTMTAFGACDYGANVCANAGMQSRNVETFHCTSGTCHPTPSTESRACTRNTEGTMCAAPTYGAWSACDFGGSACAQTGMQSRMVTMSACHSGSCAIAMSSESQACTRTTDGTSCGAPTMGMWSTCVTSGCGTTGTQTRMNTTPTCMSGGCAAMSTTEMQPCTVPSTDGLPCGAAMCSGWSACMQTVPMSCDASAQQTRTCATPACMGGTCAMGTSSLQTQACSVSVNGQPCSVTTCDMCRTGGLNCMPRGHAGSQTCWTTTGTCMPGLSGPYCGGALPTSSTVACTCP